MLGKYPKKEISGKEGFYTWPIWTVQLILYQIVNGTLPEAISPNIASQTDLDKPGVKVILQELSIINFIQSFRTIILIIGETLADCCIGKVEQWDQLFSDGTCRRQNALHNFFISIIDEERIRPLILPTLIILKGKTSEHQVEPVLSTVVSFRR